MRRSDQPQANGPAPETANPGSPCLTGLTGVWELLGVADGTRTHDNRNHNPGLYQLSYSHRRAKKYNLKIRVRWQPMQVRQL